MNIFMIGAAKIITHSQIISNNVVSTHAYLHLIVIEKKCLKSNHLKWNPTAETLIFQRCQNHSCWAKPQETPNSFPLPHWHRVLFSQCPATKKRSWVRQKLTKVVVTDSDHFIFEIEESSREVYDDANAWKRNFS